VLSGHVNNPVWSHIYGLLTTYHNRLISRTPQAVENMEPESIIMPMRFASTFRRSQARTFGSLINTSAVEGSQAIHLPSLPNVVSIHSGDIQFPNSPPRLKNLVMCCISILGVRVYHFGGENYTLTLVNLEALPIPQEKLTSLDVEAS
jgi:hypothetical protein